MYITCQECNTTFRLDESLLKPSGSKVRCSQCGNIFIAAPPTPVVTGTREPKTDLTPEPIGEDTGGQGLNGIDLAELDSLLYSKRPLSSNAGTHGETAAPEGSGEDESTAIFDHEFDMDFDAALESEIESDSKSPSPAPAKEDPLEDLDLEMDFNLEDSDSQLETAHAPRNKADSAEFELDLSDIDLNTEIEETIFDDLTSLNTPLDELKLDFDQEANTFAKGQNSEVLNDLPEAELDLADQLDLEFDSNPAPAAATEQSRPHDEFKELQGDDLLLSDLDAILDEADLEAHGGSREEVELELDSGPSSKNHPPQHGSTDEQLEDLAFELDAEYEDKPIAHGVEPDAEALSEEDEEIDLSEIELMLEGDGENSESAPSGQTAAIKSPPSNKVDSELGSDDGEIDLSELEAAIDMADTYSGKDDAATVAEEDLDLSFDSDIEPDSDVELDFSEPEPLDAEEELKLEMASRTEGIENNPDKELDLTDFEDILLDEKPAKKPEIIRSNEIELEFQIEAEQAVTSAPVQEQFDTMTPESGPVFDKKAVKAAQAAKAAPPRSKPLGKKEKKTSSALLIIFILILLGAIGYGIYYAITTLGIQIPYVSEYLNPAPRDPAGIANLSTMEIVSKFIESEQSGRLFVISGKVHSAYAHPRGQIRLQGKLFTKGKVLAQTEQVYAGNVLNDQELVNTPTADLKRRLNTPAPGVRVLPNQNLPFMVIFSNLPAADELDEFAVELISSVQAQ